MAKITDKHWIPWTKFGHPSSGLLCERKFGEVLLWFGLEKVSNWECRQGWLLSVPVDDIRMTGEQQNSAPMGWWKMILTSQFHFLINVNVNRPKFLLRSNRKIVSVGETSLKNCPVASRYGRICEKVRWEVLWVSKPKVRAVVQKSQLFAWMMTTSRRRNLNQLENCQKYVPQIVLTFLYLTWIGRLDILWSVNKLARSVFEWTGACDRRLARLFSYIHHTSDYRQCCLTSNTTQHYRLGLFQDSDFADDLEDSKLSSCGNLCIFRIQTFVIMSWMCWLGWEKSTHGVFSVPHHTAHTPQTTPQTPHALPHTTHYITHKITRRQRKRHKRKGRRQRRGEKKKRTEKRCFCWKMSQTSKIPKTNKLIMFQKKNLRTIYSLGSSESYPCFQLFTWFEFEFSARGNLFRVS